MHVRPRFESLHVDNIREVLEARETFDKRFLWRKISWSKMDAPMASKIPINFHFRNSNSISKLISELRFWLEMVKITKFWKNLSSISILYSVWKSLFINLVPYYSDFIWLFNILKLYFGSSLKKCQKLPYFCPILANFCPSKISELINFEFRNRYWDSISEFRNSISELEALVLIACLRTNRFAIAIGKKIGWVMHYTLGSIFETKC